MPSWFLRAAGKGYPVSVLFGKKGRRAAALGVAGVGASVLLAACGPVQMGSAAIVGNQRITVSSLDSDASNLQAGATKYASILGQINAQEQQQGGALPISSTPLPQLVLHWRINFAIMDRLAKNNGISVSPEQGVSALSSQVKQSGLSQSVFLTAIGIPLSMTTQAQRYFAQGVALAKKFPPNTAGSDPVLAKGQCTAAKSLDIRVNPQYGRFDFSQYNLVPGNETLSRPAGTPSPSNTAGTSPAC